MGNTFWSFCCEARLLCHPKEDLEDKGAHMSHEHEQRLLLKLFVILTTWCVRNQKSYKTHPSYQFWNWSEEIVSFCDHLSSKQCKERKLSYELSNLFRWAHKMTRAIGDRPEGDGLSNCSLWIHARHACQVTWNIHEGASTKVDKYIINDM